MDGPTIQEASVNALARGANPAKILSELAGVDCGVPLVAMTYYNLVFHGGLDRFAGALVEAGVAGVIVPDVPLEEIGPWAEAADAAGVETVLLAAPTAPDERLPRICERSRGFVYAVSLLGITGERQRLADTALGMATRLKAVTDKPVLVGIGISTAAQAVEACTVADGVIMASALDEAPPRRRLRGRRRCGCRCGPGGARPWLTASSHHLRTPACELCEAARFTHWYHEDDRCWVADCEVCETPMVVWRHHGTEPPADQVSHMIDRLRRRCRGALRARRVERGSGHATDPRPLPCPRARSRLDEPALGLAAVAVHRRGRPEADLVSDAVRPRGRRCTSWLAANPGSMPSSSGSTPALPKTRCCARSTPTRTSPGPASGCRGFWCSTGVGPTTTAASAAIRGCECGTLPTRIGGIERDRWLVHMTTALRAAGAARRRGGGGARLLRTRCGGDDQPLRGTLNTVHQRKCLT